MLFLKKYFKVQMQSKTSKFPGNPIYFCEFTRFSVTKLKF